VAAGVDLEPHFDEVHRANMTKILGRKREDGKQLKPEGWTGPDHEKILQRQEADAERWKKLEKTFWSSNNMTISQSKDSPSTTS
jgi:predicted HAD superfamily Cof-like phosphohydrolase